MKKIDLRYVGVDLHSMQQKHDKEYRKLLRRYKRLDKLCKSAIRLSYENVRTNLEIEYNGI